MTAMLTKATVCAVLLHSAFAQSSSSLSSSGASTTTPASISSVPTRTVSTVVASASVAPDTPLQSQVALPPKQAWCPSEIFCAGELLQAVNVAGLYADPKTFVDKPTGKSSQQVLSDFQDVTSTGLNSTSVGNITNFVNEDFRGEGLELQALTLKNFNPSPKFLTNVSDSLVRSWAQTVHGYWTQLIRGTNSSTLCGSGANSSCESSLIPLNHTFVVPGGRFREQYYWDSFWIVEGLIESELYDIVNATLQNFMDELEQFGFIPNGGRIYYLNRSQPPLFIHMLTRYVTATNDTSILQRALPLAESELEWWGTKRTVNVTSPFSNKTYAMAHFAVNNSAPRPESYLTDYLTANDPTLTTPLNETQRSDLYAELASGAESGWDYTVRWFSQREGGNAGLRSLEIRNIIPVDLNSILYKARINLASLYDRSSSTSDKAKQHRSVASSIKAGILDLLWDSQKFAFYDFNLRTKNHSEVFSAAHFYPFWNGIVPKEVIASKDNAFKAFSSVHLVLSRYNGTFPATFIDSGLQWDAPNAWPPHQYIALEALRSLPSNVSSGSLPSPSANQSTFSLVPSGQLGLEENQLPGQPLRIEENGVEPNATSTGSSADVNLINNGTTVTNGGNATEGEGWNAQLQRELANRYISSAFCSWRATGGSIEGVLPQLSPEELNVTQSINNTGNMFEKFSNIDIDSAGRGGEYTVQAGFGWTNGVALWIASTYGKQLVAPSCPNLLDTTIAHGAGGNQSNSENGANGEDADNNNGEKHLSVTAWFIGLPILLSLFLQ